MINMLRCLRWTKTMRNGDSGQALLETALTVPFLMMILVGGAEVARIAYAGIEVSSAASAAVQYAAQGSGNSVDLTGMTAAAEADAGNLQGMTVLTPTYALVCSDGTVPADSTTGGSNTDCPGSDKITVMTVYTKFSMPTLFHYPGLPATINLYGHATQKVLGE
jgi:Flp pilus assembly protein TadG